MTEFSRITPILLFILILIAMGISCRETKPAFTCTDTIGCVDIAPDEPFKIGVLQSLSGKIAVLGTEQIRGFSLAMDKINGKILGHDITLQTEDTGCTSEGGANAVLRIIADPQTIAIFGTTCSGAAKTTAHAMSGAGLTMISGNNSAPFLTAMDGKKAPEWHAGYFRTSKNEEHAGKAAAQFARKKLGIANAAAINDGDIYTKGLTDGFVREFVNLGGYIVLDTAVNKGEEHMTPVLTAVINSRAELLFFPLFQPEGNLMLRQAREMPGMEKVVLMSDGALIEKSFLDDVKELGKGLYFVGPSSPEKNIIESMALEYSEKYHVQPPNTYYLYAYDAACLLFYSIEKTAFKEPDGTIHIGRQALRDAMYNITNFKGKTGSLTCDPFGDCATPSFHILKLDDPEKGIEGLQSNIQSKYAFEKISVPIKAMQP